MGVALVTKRIVNFAKEEPELNVYFTVKDTLTSCTLLPDGVLQLVVVRSLKVD